MTINGAFDQLVISVTVAVPAGRSARVTAAPGSGRRRVPPPRGPRKNRFIPAFRGNATSRSVGPRVTSDAGHPSDSRPGHRVPRERQTLTVRKRYDGDGIDPRIRLRRKNLLPIRTTMVHFKYLLLATTRSCAAT